MNITYYERSLKRMNNLIRKLENEKIPNKLRISEIERHKKECSTKLKKLQKELQKKRNKATRKTFQKSTRKGRRKMFKKVKKEPKKK